ncbi:MAG: ATP-binding protein [Lachnospiraceae bacterium]|nr:ATP-binding protein [Lachnospiraceae bacterium]
MYNRIKEMQNRFLKKLQVKKIWFFIVKNDVVAKIYLSFTFVLVLTSLLTGIIFIRLYRQNYIRSHAELLAKQGKKIAKRVARFERNGKIEQFLNYSTYIDEIESAENTDVWIISNENASRPLNKEYTSGTASGSLTDDMYDVIYKAYEGKISSSSSYDDIYGMAALRVAVPVFDKGTGEASGVVMMVSMIDKQTMGIDKGTYLIISSLFLSFLVSFGVAFLFSQYLSKPLAKISRNINRISKGDYSPVKPRKPETQLGRIETTLDRLAKQLGQAEKERESLEQVRRDFFANVSHELRTPITVIRGYAETLNDGVITEQHAVEDMYQRMLSECQSMERLVGDLFILSKMQNPDFQVEKEPVSLMQIFGDISRSEKVIGKEKNIQFKENFPGDDPCMMLGDYVRLRQMFLIIIDNAVKFSHENGNIATEIYKKSEKLHIKISDEGVGISKEELPYIFEKFYKSKLKQNEKGTGLGLMIAKQIALKHDGVLTVQSEKGKGTTFFFEFDECTSMEGYE